MKLSCFSVVLWYQKESRYTTAKCSTWELHISMGYMWITCGLHLSRCTSPGLQWQLSKHTTQRVGRFSTSQGCQTLTPNGVNKLATNGTNPELFNILRSVFKYTKKSEKVPDLSHMGTIWHTYKPHLHLTPPPQTSSSHLHLTPPPHTSSSACVADNSDTLLATTASSLLLTGWSLNRPTFFSPTPPPLGGLTRDDRASTRRGRGRL